VVTLSKHGKRMGRPPLYNNCLDFACMIELYFEHCEEGRLIEGITKKGEPFAIHKRIPPSIYGLCAFLGFNDPHALIEYEKKIDFTSVSTRARTRIAQLNLEMAQMGEIGERITQNYMAVHHDMNPKHEFKVDSQLKLPDESVVVVQQIAQRAAMQIIHEYRNGDKLALPSAK